MASKLRGAASSTWPPGGAGRRASTEVEKTESQQKIHISAHVQSSPSPGGMKRTGPGPIISMLSSLQPRASGLPSCTLPSEAPSWCSWNLPHHPFLTSRPSIGSNRRQTTNNEEPSKLSFTHGKEGVPLGRQVPISQKSHTFPQAPRKGSSTMNSSQVSIKETWVAAESPGSALARTIPVPF